MKARCIYLYRMEKIKHNVYLLITATCFRNIRVATIRLRTELFT